MSLIHTSQLCGANSLEYLVELQRHTQQLSLILRNGCLGTTARPWHRLKYDGPTGSKKDLRRILVAGKVR